ncbi:MAG: DUF5652 family protein [bacterium]|nr:DUF5652 family protein [bacterium]
MMQFMFTNPILILIGVAWSLAWKGVALWRSARRNDMWWFVALLVINTLGILEIVYIVFFSERPKHDTK